MTWYNLHFFAGYFPSEEALKRHNRLSARAIRHLHRRIVRSSTDIQGYRAPYIPSGYTGR